MMERIDNAAIRAIDGSHLASLPNKIRKKVFSLHLNGLSGCDCDAYMLL